MSTEQKYNNHQARLMQVLLQPHLSEKSAIVADKFKQFVFKVTRDANKLEIKQAVEMLFNVGVESVQVCNVKAKTRRFKQREGSRQSWKKAYVALKPGFDIDFTGSK